MCHLLRLWPLIPVSVSTVYLVTNLCQCVTLQRSCWLFFLWIFLWVHRISEICLPKTMNMISKSDPHELVLVIVNMSILFKTSHISHKLILARVCLPGGECPLLYYYNILISIVYSFPVLTFLTSGSLYYHLFKFPISVWSMLSTVWVCFVSQSCHFPRAG